MKRNIKEIPLQPPNTRAVNRIGMQIYEENVYKKVKMIDQKQKSDPQNTKTADLVFTSSTKYIILTVKR